jgi:hypothetical protein
MGGSAVFGPTDTGSTDTGPTSPAADGASSHRASDADRDEAVSALQEQFVAGRLSHDTFLVRIHTALSARRSHELKPLLADLPEPARSPTLRERARALTTPVAAAVRMTVSTARSVNFDFSRFGRTDVGSSAVPLYFPPDGGRSVFTIGREAGCDFAIADMTVSRTHARLTRVKGEGEAGGCWLLADLGSTNGTRVNGWRVLGPVVVRAGDRVRFGGTVFVMRDVP